MRAAGLVGTMPQRVVDESVGPVAWHPKGYPHGKGLERPKAAIKIEAAAVEPIDVSGRRDTRLAGRWQIGGESGRRGGEENRRG
jgi:hypothetical protein